MKVFNNEFVTLYNCDSRQIPIPDESVDCVVTSPLTMDSGIMELQLGLMEMITVLT